MCGRYTHFYTWKEVHDYLSAFTLKPVELPKSYNVAPTQKAPVIRINAEGEKCIDLLRWGLIPSWAKDPKVASSLINARGETVATKPSFRSAFAKRRCIVPASGFYEWKGTTAGKKQPYFIFSPDKTPLLFAGLWERWESPTKDVLETFTIVTTKANSALTNLHERMPIILNPEQADVWLNPNAPLEEIAEALKTATTLNLEYFPVSTAVNSPRKNSPECVERIDIG